VLAAALTAVVLWVVDMGLRPPQDAALALSDLFFLLCGLLPAGVAAGTFFRVVLGPPSLVQQVVDRASRSLRLAWSGGRDAGYRTLTWLAGLAVALPAAAALAFALDIRIAQDVVRPRLAAMLNLGVSFLAVLVGLVVYVFVTALGDRLKPRVVATSVLRLLWARPLVPVAMFAAALAGGTAWLLYGFRAAVRVAPWVTPLIGLGAFAAAAVCTVAAVHWLGRPLRWRLTMGAVAVLTLLSAAPPLSLDTTDAGAHAYFRQVRSGSIVYQGLERLLDRDGDGAMDLFAGGDCQPDDGSVYPTAIEVPDNGVDEDCDGGDLAAAEVERGKWDFPVPPGLLPPRTPVFLLTLDGVSYSHMSMNGYGRKTTPNLDRLAPDCVVFDAAFSQGPSTRLSMASMFTSRYDSQIATEGGTHVPHPLADENLTMAELFRMNGYWTVAVASNAYFTGRWKGILQGFDTVDRSAVLPGTRGLTANNADRLVAAVLEHLKSRDGRPVFLWAHFFDPHGPFMQPRLVPKFGQAREDKYDAEVRWTDLNVGRLVGEIDRAHRKTGYVLVIAADHGTSFDGHHKRYNHGYDLYAATTRIPLLICSPSIPGRSVAGSPVTLTDLLPTLVNLLGLRAPGAQFEGRSLVPLMLSDADWKDRIVLQQFFLVERERKGMDPLSAAAVKTARHNFIWNREQGTLELYDYLADPEETQNLTDAEPELAARLESVLKTWLYLVRDADGPEREPVRQVQDGSDPDDDGGKDDEAEDSLE
jgi:arylsulfatase A-like enzyme